MNLFSYNDWYIVADADEFVSQDFRSVIEIANKTYSDHVLGEFINYHYTEKDADNWRNGTESLLDRSKSIRDRRRYYLYNTSQVRAFRNLPWLRWNEDTSFPVWLSRPCNRRIRFFHYQYRDIPQIEQRIRIRRSVVSIADAANTHWNKCSVQDAILPNDYPDLQYDSQDGTYVPSSALSSPPGRQGAVKTFAKYSRAFIYGILVAQEPSNWFTLR